MKTEILYEDNDILVIYKPAGLATQTAKVGQQDVVSELKNYLRQITPYLGVIHRLDQPVEGLLVFAKNRKAAAGLTGQLQSRGDSGSLHKHYYAVICGKPLENQGELVDYMYKSKDNLAVIVDSPAGTDAEKSKISESEAGSSRAAQPKKAVLQYRIVETVPNPMAASGAAGQVPLALADITILTGRFHQIRAQMAHANMPLLGDAKYGSEEAKAASKALGIPNAALCAYSLEFVHPISKKKLHFEVKPKGKAFSTFLHT